MDKVFVKVENIPGKDDLVFDEIYIPIHHIHILSRTGNILRISYEGDALMYEGKVVEYKYEFESEELAKEAIKNILEGGRGI
jgi:hypothetical protein